MHLRRLELQGFKTVASKTALEFRAETANGRGGMRRGLTGIVGPNGSGKSNIADAIRWVMGEQSMKLLRGKKSEDVIFSGSDKKARSGFAEVSLFLENDGAAAADGNDLPQEVVITRRLYRDGKSEYEVNRQAARHGDVVLLLAQCGIGQRTYSVIGQGMIDAILIASPADRKEFFDEASGLRPFQLKRTQAMNKLEGTAQNLSQADALLREIGPRLTSLERQMKRLQERAGLEDELTELERTYYGGMWHDIFGNQTKVKAMVDRARGEEVSLVEAAKTLEAELAAMEKAVPPSEGFDVLRAQLDAIAEDRAALREKQATLQAQMEIAKVRHEKPWAPLPLSKIIQNVEVMGSKLDALVSALSATSPDLKKARLLAEELHVSHGAFVSALQAPAPEPTRTAAVDPKITQALEEIGRALNGLSVRTQKTQQDIEAWKKGEEDKRAHLFNTQRELGQKRSEAMAAERRANEAAVELARWETRREAFLNELKAHHPDWEAGLNTLAQGVGSVPQVEQLQQRLTRVRSQLEWIGGIDPETQKEYEQTKERFSFLHTQTEDLKGAMNGLRIIIEELDETIRTRSETAFHLLNVEFGRYFKKLFDGGEARLLQMEPEPENEEDEDESEDGPAERNPAAGGIDIQATPPGKRMKSIALLSGGEKALTSIALICAIMATNPSPFVVLDEVDAALDEANSKKFADILLELSDKTQFVVVTHNRATMHQANVLYGVTLGEDGTSQLLSVKLEELRVRNT